MKIAILSGKGGTGKTLLAVNLAALVPSTYIDCDVEEPNGHLFFKGPSLEEEYVEVMIPKLNQDLCQGHKKCVEFCRYNALAYTGEKLLIFEDICHSCAGCLLVCPQGSLSEGSKEIGKIEKRIVGNVDIYTGILNLGQPSGVPIIERLLEIEKDSEKKYTFIDSPPGTACIVMESIKDADYCLLVAEPTIFGAHNLNMVYQLVSLFGKPFSVLINKWTHEKNPAEDFCKEKDIKILGRIPFDRDLGLMNSEGKIGVQENEKYRDLFSSILDRLKEEVKHERNSSS